MSDKRKWDLASQPAVHQYIEQTLVLPYLAKKYKTQIIYPQDKQYHKKQKNGDRLFLANDTAITLERKHDRSTASDDFAFELLGNQSLSSWADLPPRLRRNKDATAHRKMVEKISKYRFTEMTDNTAGLIFADVSKMGDHYTIAARHYAKENRTECWLLSTRMLQSEIKQNLMHIDVGRTMPEKYGDNWKVVLAFVALPSIIFTNRINSIAGDCIEANWDITDVYPHLVDKMEMPNQMINTSII